MARSLATRAGPVTFPAYLPVSTFNNQHPLDQLIRPYLTRLAPAVMVSYVYARAMVDQPEAPLWVDSGGFAALASGAHVAEAGGLGQLQTSVHGVDATITPKQVLDLQERVADVAFTLDFPVPRAATRPEARRRERLTRANAHWALANRRRGDLPLYACLQAEDTKAARRAASDYATAGFEGVAIGGLAQTRDMSHVESIVKSVRDALGEAPLLHVFGIGDPRIVRRLYAWGVDSVDSSSYARLAASGRSWRSATRLDDPSPTDRLRLAICNLAEATGAALPFSSLPMVFSTLALQRPADSPASRPVV